MATLDLNFELPETPPAPLALAADSTPHADVQAPALAPHLEDLQLDWHLPCDGPKTLNGLVTEALETIPETTVCLKIGGYRLEILQTEENRVSSVLIWHNSVKPAA